MVRGHLACSLVTMRMGAFARREAGTPCGGEDWMSGEGGGDWGVARESLTRGTGRARGSAFEAALTRWTSGLNEQPSSHPNQSSHQLGG
ncbi:hypothetical protein HPB50_014393 [Hyalomma asiaticum]|uniref:Uncharacterized protein n=1 Tax=Hyalomma asiaticum TaxID=266040 RepID=A0ACB7SHZ3_HYAAI|nr:hypothetical protein HPB50_014393 [Hyalomma asiaticum]